LRSIRAVASLFVTLAVAVTACGGSSAIPTTSPRTATAASTSPSVATSPTPAATVDASPTPRQLWAIGVDSDQYETLRVDPANLDWRAWRPHILTSMVKRMDTGIYEVLADYSRGTFRPGAVTLGLAASGVDVSYSGGFIDGLRPMIDAWRAKIVAGDVVVPCIPVDRETKAKGLSPTLTGCGG
jgi:hypothetical protein